MMTGTVKMFNTARGFGFIKPDEGGNDVFVHIKEAAKTGVKDLREGDRVSYELYTDERTDKPAATAIALL